VVLMDIAQIRSLIADNEKVKELESEDFFLSSLMVVAPNLSSAPESIIVNFYNKEKNQIASFSAEPSGLKFSSISPPIKEVEITTLAIEKILLNADEAMKKCSSNTKDDEISRVVGVLRMSSNLKNENGPCWHINMFLKTLKVLSVVIDAESGQEIASSTSKLTS